MRGGRGRTFVVRLLTFDLLRRARWIMATRPLKVCCKGPTFRRTSPPPIGPAAPPRHLPVPPSRWYFCCLLALFLCYLSACTTLLNNGC
jgi:hypothetical protein